MTKIEQCKKIIEQGSCLGLDCENCPARVDPNMNGNSVCRFKGVRGPSQIPWFQQWLEENEVKETPSMGDICANCGKRYGNHKGPKCPDRNGGFSDTSTFEKLVRVEVGKWYKWIGCEIPNTWNDDMGAFLDGKPRECIMGDHPFLKFNGIEGGPWNYREGCEYFREVPAPGEVRGETSEPQKGMDPGKGYRVLGRDELIQRGDEAMMSGAGWTKLELYIGRKASFYIDVVQKGLNFTPVIRRKVESGFMSVSMKEMEVKLGAIVSGSKPIPYLLENMGTPYRKGPPIIYIDNSSAGGKMAQMKREVRERVLAKIRFGA